MANMMLRPGFEKTFGRQSSVALFEELVHSLGLSEQCFLK